MNADSIAPKIGRKMMILAWIIGLGLMTWTFGSWQEERRNPNSSPQSAEAGGATQVKLLRNRQGHYVTSGKINQQAVTFLIDTGATTVAIPGELQQALGLNAGNRQSSITANGTATSYATLIERLEIGEIVLFDVRASILPNMPGQQILLGMSALREIEFSQKGDRLILRQAL
ncbi:MAG: aspartyl protease family protein [Motiliproteus sp.]|jgi:aspartyl protease family protein